MILLKSKNNKLNNKKGFTIAELLLVVAILSVVLSAVTIGVSSSMRQYRQAMRMSQTDILYATLYEAIVAELRTGTAIKIDDDGELLSYHSKMLNINGNLTEGIVSADGTKAENTEGMIFVGAQPIISANAYMDGVKAYLDPIIYNTSDETFSIKLELKIEKEGEEDYIKSHTFKVHPMNGVTRETDT